MPHRIRFIPAISKAEKTTAKTRTESPGARTIPLAVRGRLELDEDQRAQVGVRLARKLGSFASHVERVSVRFEDADGPRGINAVCRVKVVLRALPSVVVEERAADPLVALGRAAEAAGRAVRRAVRRADRSSPRAVRRSGKGAPVGRRGALRWDDEGSLIGRRVGQGQANLERALARPEKQRRDAYVDTAMPGVSATDRRAGYGATAARNTKRNTAGMTAALEDSRTTPSRKSTRKSQNRARSATLLELKARHRLLSPTAKATRGKAR
jgi:hypothetical protein